MRLSITARVLIGLLAQTVVLIGASLLLIANQSAILEYISNVKDKLEPVALDLKDLVAELKDMEDTAGKGSRDGMLKLWGRLPRINIFDRLQFHLSTISDVWAFESCDDNVRNSLKRASELLQDVVAGDRVAGQFADILDKSRLGSNKEAMALAWEKLGNAIGASKEDDAKLIGAKMVSAIKFIRAMCARAGQAVLEASREANNEVYLRRERLSYLFVAVPVSACLIGLLVAFVTFLAIRDLGRLAVMVERMGKGGAVEIDPERFSGEVRLLASALRSLLSGITEHEKDLERKTEELMRAERLALVGRMASVVAHEIRNPLNSISLNVDLLKEMLNDCARLGDARTILASVEKEVERLAEITEEYLRFARLPKGSLGPCRLGAVVKATLDFMSGEFESHGVTVDVAIGSDSEVLGDESQIRHALVNLFKNALEAMPNGGKVFVEMQDAGDKVLLKVRDTGSGIPDEFKPKLFEPFATTKPYGTGLGLAFVLQVMQECKGKVWIDSMVNHGTTVTLEFLRYSGGEA
jgi:signal transduction histidine kinase